MKEIVIQLEDCIAVSLGKDAKKRGLTSSELIKYILGDYAIEHVDEIEEATKATHKMLVELAAFTQVMDSKMLKMRANAGALSCKDCTMKLTEEDVQKGICGACGATIS